MVDQPVVLSESGESTEVEGPSARDVVYAERLEGGIEVVFLNQPKKKNEILRCAWWCCGARARTSRAVEI